MCWSPQEDPLNVSLRRNRMVHGLIQFNRQVTPRYAFSYSDKRETFAVIWLTFGENQDGLNHWPAFIACPLPYS
ncbi:hypothetical protein ACJJIU_09815 [Microbulbifer sp. CnH-101-E]|uniref:hypothetical protein n=1 Tax=unclassified Microbulbifer TaxID=2619833 RepID=UPI00403A2077